MCRILVLVLTLLTACFPTMGQGQPVPGDETTPSLLTVRGNAEVSAIPDRAVLQLGAVARSKAAAEAQDQVSRTMKDILGALKAAGVPEKKISTSELRLTPLHDRRDPVEQGALPRIVGYLAANRIRIEIEEMHKIGEVIDAGLSAGANKLEGLSFALEDDAPFRKRALREAVQSAREKAEVIAETLNVRLLEVHEVSEENVHILRPQFRVERMLGATSESTPVEPGQLRVSASVIIRYRIGNP